MTDREINEKLAMAMGWTRRERGWVEPGRSVTHADPPDYFNGPAAHAELVDWLGAQRFNLRCQIYFGPLVALAEAFVGSGGGIIHRESCEVMDSAHAALRRATALAAVRAVEVSK